MGNDVKSDWGLGKKQLVAISIMLLSGSILFAYLIKLGDVKTGVMIMLVMLGPPIAFSIVAYPKFGIFTLMIAAWFIMVIIRMNIVQFPLGTIMDGLEGLLILGLFIKQKYERDWSSMKNPISIMILVWIAYNLLEVINPYATSKMAWLYTVRSLALVMFNYFVFSYHIKSIGFVKNIIKLWLGLSVFAALYGFKQKYIGFFPFEEAYLYSDPSIFDLLFINGEWRKFSMFSDPVAFSYNMVVSSLLCIGILSGPVSKARKWILSIMIVCFIMNMFFSGTRGAYVLLPAALLFLAVVNFNKRVLIITAVTGAITFFLIMIPTSNVTLYRFQSAFKPSNDGSFNVRAVNQKRIQPFIQSHPMGGGLGATGVWGTLFSPGSFLASFPPDSGYVRTAVEMGWIGLLLFCFLMYAILRTAVVNYYRIQDPELKSYCLAMLLIMFALNIGNYPQEAIVQFPTNIYFLLVAALINVLYKLDVQKREENKVIET